MPPGLEVEPGRRDEEVVRLQDVCDLFGNGMVQPVLVDLAVLLRAEAERVATSETDVCLAVLKDKTDLRTGANRIKIFRVK